MDDATLRRMANAFSATWADTAAPHLTANPAYRAKVALNALNCLDCALGGIPDDDAVAGMGAEVLARRLLRAMFVIDGVIGASDTINWPLDPSRPGDRLIRNEANVNNAYRLLACAGAALTVFAETATNRAGIDYARITREISAP